MRKYFDALMATHLRTDCGAIFELWGAQLSEQFGGPTNAHISAYNLDPARFNGEEDLRYVDPKGRGLSGKSSLHAHPRLFWSQNVGDGVSAIADLGKIGKTKLFQVSLQNLQGTHR